MTPEEAAQDGADDLNCVPSSMIDVKRGIEYLDDQWVSALQHQIQSELGLITWFDHEARLFNLLPPETSDDAGVSTALKPCKVDLESLRAHRPPVAKVIESIRVHAKNMWGMDL